MARLITAKMQVMLAYKAGDPCGICNEPMHGTHAGREDIALINGAWRMVHPRHNAGIFHGVPQPDPQEWFRYRTHR